MNENNTQVKKEPTILLEIVKNKHIEVINRKKKTPLTKIKEQISPSKRNFKSALQKKRLSLIAEIKQTSPSEKNSFTTDFQPKKIAQEYELFGADAISVLCDEKFFSGSLNYLKIVEKNTKYIPLLCKDFFIDEYQIYEARHYGADCILLIAAILTSQQIQNFLTIARSLSMDAICEIHNETELEKVLKTDADIIGINNRNLHTFEINLNTTKRLAAVIPKNKIIISESGIYTKDDVKNLLKNISAVLVGSALMKHQNKKEIISELAHTYA